VRLGGDRVVKVASVGRGCQCRAETFECTLDVAASLEREPHRLVDASPGRGRLVEQQQCVLVVVYGLVQMTRDLGVRSSFVVQLRMAMTRQVTQLRKNVSTARVVIGLRQVKSATQPTVRLPEILP